MAVVPSAIYAGSSITPAAPTASTDDTAMRKSFAKKSFTPEKRHVKKYRNMKMHVINPIK